MVGVVAVAVVCSKDEVGAGGVKSSMSDDGCELMAFRLGSVRLGFAGVIGGGRGIASVLQPNSDRPVLKGSIKIGQLG